MKQLASAAGVSLEENENKKSSKAKTSKTSSASSSSERDDAIAFKPGSRVGGVTSYAKAANAKNAPANDEESNTQKQDPRAILEELLLDTAKIHKSERATSKEKPAVDRDDIDMVMWGDEDEQFDFEQVETVLHKASLKKSEKKHHIMNVSDAATVMQAHYRGYRVRKDLSKYLIRLYGDASVLHLSMAASGDGGLAAALRDVNRQLRAEEANKQGSGDIDMNVELTFNNNAHAGDASAKSQNPKKGSDSTTGADRARADAELRLKELAAEAAIKEAESEAALAHEAARKAREERELRDKNRQEVNELFAEFAGAGDGKIQLKHEAAVSGSLALTLKEEQARTASLRTQERLARSQELE